VLDSAEGYVERGVASWYGSKFHGRRTSSGETYDMHAMTAAHKSLPLPTYVRVTNLRNGRSTVLRVNDRGPFHANRIIDLSHAAARKLDIIRQGTGLVEVRALMPGRAAPQAPAAPAPAPVPVAQAAPAAAPPAAPRMFLQAGAFAENVNAERLRARLASMSGVKVGVYQALVDGQQLFRVRIGPLADVAEADRLSSRIVDAGMGLPRIVID
jgi:rare lipoprotein A